MGKERIINGVIYEFPDSMNEAQIRKFEISKTGGNPPTSMPGSPPPAPSGPRPAPLLDGFGGSALQGLTMGFSDEAIARMRALGGKHSYEDYVKAEREGQRKYSEDSPVASTTAELLGGVAPALLTGGAGAIPAVARTVGPKVAGFLAGKAPSVARMMGYGAASGATSAVGTSEKPLTELPAEALKGAASGAALTGTIGTLGKYVAAPAFSKLKSAMGFGDANKMADVVIAKALQKDGLTPDQALAKMQAAARGEITLADLGENTAALLRKATAAPGAARREAKDTLATRELERIPRVSEDMRTLMSGSKDFYTDVQDLIKKRSTEADALYQAAWDSNAKFSSKTAPDIERLRNLPSFKDAMKSGAKRMADAGLDITDPKNTLRGLHETKIALDDMISEAIRQGKGGQASVLMSMKERMLKDMEKAAPEYKTARLAYAGDSEMLTAMEEGRKIYQLPEMDMRKLIDRFKDNPSEFDAFRAGIAQSMLEKLRVAGPAADPMKTVLGRDMEQKIRRAFRDDDAFDEFKRRLAEEQRMLTTEKTGFRKTAQDTDLDTGASGVGAATRLAQGNPLGAAIEATQAAVPRLTGMGPRVSQPVQEKLLTPTAGIDPVVDSIMQSLKAQEQMLMRASTAGNVGAANMGGLSGQRGTTEQYPEDTLTPQAPGMPVPPPPQPSPGLGTPQ
jgi:hypothetical protein